MANETKTQTQPTMADLMAMMQALQADNAATKAALAETKAALAVAEAKAKSGFPDPFRTEVVALDKPTAKEKARLHIVLSKWNDREMGPTLTYWQAENMLRHLDEIVGFLKANIEACKV